MSHTFNTMIGVLRTMYQLKVALSPARIPNKPRKRLVLWGTELFALGGCRERIGGMWVVAKSTSKSSESTDNFIVRGSVRECGDRDKAQNIYGTPSRLLSLWCMRVAGYLILISLCIRAARK